jgi:hypothetical protein
MKKRVSSLTEGIDLRVVVEDKHEKDKELTSVDILSKQMQRRTTPKFKCRKIELRVSLFCVLLSASIRLSLSLSRKNP